MCAHILHILIILLRRTPSGDLTAALGVVDVVFGREADSCDCTCVRENREQLHLGRFKGLNRSFGSPLARMEPK